MPIWQQYEQPHTVDDALEYLGAGPGPNAIIAGGTDLLIDLQQGRHAPVHTLVDVTGIPELGQLREEPGGFWLGAAVTHSAIVDHPWLRRHARCLTEACGLIGGPQVRNVATIGGNVAHGLPAGDGTIALVALGAEVQVAGRAGRRRMPVTELFLGPGRTILAAGGEILAGFHLPFAGDRSASAFDRIMRPQGVAIAILNLAAWLQCEADGGIAAIRLAVGPAGPTPFRARRTEEVLQGRKPDSETLAAAAAELCAEAPLRASPHRATLAYRRQTAGVLLARVVETAWNRAMVETACQT